MRYQRLSYQKQARILKCFCEDITAVSAAMIVGANRNTINACYREIRERIFRQTLQESGLERGEFELDESSFGAKRVRGKRLFSDC
jgi:transposase